MFQALFLDSRVKDSSEIQITVDDEENEYTHSLSL